ncbi:MAG: HlyU family transcriptional regulator [Pseudomonadota bacterium]
MSFLKKMFGGGNDGEAQSKPLAEATHEGFHIVAAPMAEGDQFRLAGTISKEINGETKTHQLIRADVFPSAEVAADATIRKAKRVIDEQGDRLFV